MNHTIMIKIILITGATSGNDKDTAVRFAREDYNLIITGRRKYPLVYGRYDPFQGSDIAEAI